MSVLGPEEQKAQLEAYLKEMGRYAEINKRAYKQLIENLGPLDTSLFDELIGFLPEETPNLDEIKKRHSEYKGLFVDGKENIRKGGSLDELFEEYKGVIKKGEKAPEKVDPKEVENTFRKMQKAYVSLVNGILMVYNPGILNVYSQIAGSVKKYAGKGKKIQNLLKILIDDYKADDLIKRIQQEQAAKEKKAA